MKKVFIILVAITLGLTTTLSAKKAPAVAAKLPVDFKQEVAKNIEYPSFAKNNLVEGVVTMRVTLDENSIVKIVDLSSTNPELGDYVRQELSDLSIKNTSFKAGMVYYMKVRFDLIKAF